MMGYEGSGLISNPETYAYVAEGESGQIIGFVSGGPEKYEVSIMGIFFEPYYLLASRRLRRYYHITGWFHQSTCHNHPTKYYTSHHGYRKFP
jgi:hypothetical protein